MTRTLLLLGAGGSRPCVEVAVGVETDGRTAAGPRGPLPEGAWTVQGRDRLALSPVEVEVGHRTGLEQEPSALL